MGLADKLLEVMSFKSLFMLALATLKIWPPAKLAQAGSVRIYMDGRLDSTIGIDGETFNTQGDGVIEVAFHSQVNYLRYDGR